MTDYWQHPDWPNFLSAIRAAPDDDVTRLVVADWLDEQGYGERAGLIRAECHNARLDREVLCHQPGAEMGDWCNDTLCPKCGREIRLFPTTPVDYGDGLRDLTDQLHGFDWDRGFLHTVRAPLVSLYGERCDVMACNGTGFNTELKLKCPTCHGTGRTAGILPDLLRREPVLRVEVVDKYPRGWTWYDETRYSVVDDPESNLPKEIIGHLKGGHWDERNACFHFEDREAATDAMSAALLSWGLGQIREGVTR